ncbi:MAG TPA: MarR family transcriptional regulator [Fimbriimonadaceae bacterium]|nr:MarR family transcriptional regulator [Fimbriimonadaceae bacterium]
MSVHDDAAQLESLLPLAMTALFRPDEEDPLRHHSVGQVRLLRSLLKGPRTATDLSNSLGLSPSSLTQMAGRMIRAGLIKKELDAQDRRVRKLSLTPAGRELMERRRDRRARSAALVLEKMDPAKFRELIALLEEIRSIGDAQNPAPAEAMV